ncbi:MAG: ATP synthase F1 subunit gamma [Candidatus Omnitrophota bacterium]|nr:ATP synthase F1 subunit gamma [Candidatus Omnitrophota bacterium]
MPQSLKVIKDRIVSVENTRKVTGAMQMVSLAKLSRVDKVLYAIRPYSLKLEGILNKLVAMNLKEIHPLLEKRTPVKKRLLCVITSDNGLCGSYNTSILQVAMDFISRHGKENVIVVTVGKRGYNFIKTRGITAHSVYSGLNGRYNYETADKISGEFTDLFLGKKVDEVWCAHTHFETAMIQRPGTEKMLPLEPKNVTAREYIVEPDAAALLNELAMESIIMKMRRIIAEAFTAEHASRVVAMKSATDNAKELLGVLELTHNKIRQSFITQEIMEIISSAEALKG